jgi:hypothetical protein
VFVEDSEFHLDLPGVRTCSPSANKEYV